MLDLPCIKPRRWRGLFLCLVSLCLCLGPVACSSPEEPDDQGAAGADGGVDMLDDGGADSGGSAGAMSGAEAGAEAGAEGGEAPAPPRAGIGVLGYGSHSISEVDVEVIGTDADGLNRPTALQVNPARPDELWVVNYRDNSVVVFFDFKGTARRSTKFDDPYAIHFLSAPTSISFDPNGQFATCQDSNNGGDFFMGPTLWSSDFDIFARSNPEAVRYLGGTDLGSHLDMLHESPLCMGVSWETGNAYWVFEGDSSSIARVDFQEDHGPGFDDHSDGIITRYAVGEVARVASYPSHLHYEQATGRLYIADTGNKRVGVLDTMVEPEAMIYQPVVEPGTQLLLVDGGPSVETLFQDEGLMRGPTGLTMHDGVLYVSDTATGRVVAFNPETGEVLDWLDTGISSPGLMGITFDAEGELYAVDGVSNRVLRFSARP